MSAEGTYRLSEAQARAILELRLQRLTGLERDKIAEELSEVAKLIEGYLELLGDRDKLFALMRTELVEIKEQFATPRRTEILDNEFEQDIEDLIQREDMVVTVTHGGYVKRVPVLGLSRPAPRRQGPLRHGHARGRFRVEPVRGQHAHAGAVLLQPRHRLQAQGLAPAARRAAGARGKAFVNLLPLSEGETISAVMPMPEDEASWSTLHVMFATARGGVRRNELSDFVNVNQNGKIAMKFEGDDAGDRLIGVGVCSEDQDVLLATRQGRAMRFPTDKVRVFASRTSTGVRGIALAEGDEVISMSLVDGGKGVTSEERDAYLRQSRARAPGRECGGSRRGGRGGGRGRGAGGRGGGGARPPRLSQERFDELQGQGGVRAHRGLVGFRQAHLGLRVSGDRSRRQGRRADESRQGRRGRRGASPCSIPTRSCWSPMAAR